MTIMKTYSNQRYHFVIHTCIFLCILITDQLEEAQAFCHPQSMKSPLLSGQKSATSLLGVPQQQPGESDMDYIRRLTTFGQDLAKKTSQSPAEYMKNAQREKEEEEKKEAAKSRVVGAYQRAEDWDADVKAKREGGELTWEEKVQFEGQKFGNQVRQNDILNRNLHSF